MPIKGNATMEGGERTSQAATKPKPSVACRMSGSGP